MDQAQGDHVLRRVLRHQHHLQGEADYGSRHGGNPFRRLSAVEQGRVHRPAPAPQRVRMARPRGAGRPRASASRSSSRSGDSGDSSGSSEGGEPPGLTALLDGAVHGPSGLSVSTDSTAATEPAQNSQNVSKFWASSRSCRHCGSSLAGHRRHAHYCSAACRAAAWRTAHQSDQATASPRKRSYEQGAGA